VFLHSGYHDLLRVGRAKVIVAIVGNRAITSKAADQKKNPRSLTKLGLQNKCTIVLKTGTDQRALSRPGCAMKIRF